MKLQGTQMTIAALLGASCAALAAGLWHTVRRAAQRQQATSRQLAALTAAVKALQEHVAELSRVTPSPQTTESIAAAAEGSGIRVLSEPKAETLAVITAAATAFLGRAAHIRSVRLTPPAGENVSPWAQQGRVIVQTSHNLRTRE